MSTTQQGWGALVRTWLRQTILYNSDDIKTLFKHLVIIVISTAILAVAWNLGWERGLTWHVMYALEAAVPGPPGPVFVAPLGFLVGLSLVFWLDPYKRLQGLLLIVPGVVTLAGAIVSFGRLRVTWALPTFAALVVSLLFGLAWGGLFEWLLAAKRPEMKRGFQRLLVVVAAVGSWGILEATVDYDSPILLDRRTPVEAFGTEIPIGVSSGSLSINGFGHTFMTSSFAMVGYFLILGALLVTLKDFTEYEMNKDILILGPDRGGKTWLMAGAGYCLRERAISDYSFERPELNQTLQAYHDIFVNRDFDSPKLEANNPDEFDFFSFSYEHGVLPKRRLRVNTIDYAGEHLQSVDLRDPWEAFERQWEGKGATQDDGIDTSTVPSIRTLEQLNEDGEIGSGDIPSLLSVMIDDYDAIALTIPADEFAHTFGDEALPEHITQKKIELIRRSRDIRRGGATGYFKIYETILNKFDDKDLFFVITMSDTFLKTYKQDDIIDHLDPKGNQNWHQFREHVLEKIQTENERSEVHFMMDPRTRSLENFYPVYFEPGEASGNSQTGKFIPDLNTDDDAYYPLRGLTHLLKRMGR